MRNLDLDAGWAAAATRRRLVRIARNCVVALFAVLMAATALAADDVSQELWPELNLFLKLTPRTRLHAVAAYAKGKESPTLTVDSGAYVDITMKPFLRPSLLAQDWKSRRYLWVRAGYVHVDKGEDLQQRERSEDRIVLAVYPRYYLPADVMIEGRARVDFRWLADGYSTRYRARIEVNREYKVANHAWVPYIQIEPFYDTRYDGWSRVLYQPGVEIELTEHFRLEPYFARQVDTLPEKSVINAFGMVAKWYY